MAGRKLLLEESRLTSTRPDQKELSFDAGNSVYDMNEYTIEANDIPFFEVADVRIYPGNH